MRRTVRKWFWVWDFDKEERWLNEMAAKGLALVSVGWCRYDFEDSLPGEYRVALEMPEAYPGTAEGQKYVEFVESTGAEHVGTLNRWIYFRRKACDGGFEMFSDNASKVKHLTRIMRFILFFNALNLYNAIYNLWMYFFENSPINVVGFLSLLVAALCGYGWFRLNSKRKKLKAEQTIFE